MADSITTTTTLKATCEELDETIDALLDAPEFTTSPSKPHEAAWSQVLRDLADRQPPVAESDLSDTDELLYATHLCVFYLLFKLSDIDADQVTAQKYWTRYRKEMRGKKLTLLGTEQPTSATETRLVRA